MPHIVWDWNGTLLDDLAVVLDAVNASLTSIGWAAITVDQYRTHYTRPVHRFYEALAGRPVTSAEWDQIDYLFHEEYRRALSRLRLASDAAAALQAQLASARSQSLLSMFPHDELAPLVERFGLAHYFERVDGLRHASGGGKEASLRAHLAALGHPAKVVLIGDTPDDLVAARANGVGCVLYDGGGHHRSTLEALGVPVASTLLEAVRHAERMPAK